MKLRTVRDIGVLVHDRRRIASLSQDQLATTAGVSRRWLAALEAGKPGAEIALVLRTFAALDIELSATNAPVTPAAVDLDAFLARFDEPPR